MSGAGDLLWTHVPEFGERLEGREYLPRPGAYAVLLDRERRRIAVVITPEGCFLPGGGAEAGETLEQALHREVSEECGLAIREVRALGRAIEFVWVAHEDRCFAKYGTFFLAAVDGLLDRAPEPDHALVWMTLAESLERLSHESQAWVVRRALAPGSEDAV